MNAFPLRRPPWTTNAAAPVPAESHGPVNLTVLDDRYPSGDTTLQNQGHA